MEEEQTMLRNELNAASDFVQQIKTGNLQADYKGAMTEHELAKVLLALRNQMALLVQQEQQRNWTNEGLAKFSELLRMHGQKDLKELLSMIIGKLVQYLHANQGCVFVLNEQDASHPILDLMACYAYDRRKYMNQTIDIGDGLIGQCFLEKEIIYMTNVPKDYVRITSGLGEATPRSVLIVPLKLNEDVLGVMEIASFQLFEQYQIDFVQKVGESIASACSSLRVSQRTNDLLKESQLQAEQLKAQEEEMRQNMEELSAAQEEMARTLQQTEAQTKIINSVAIVSKADLRGNITYVNEQFIKWSKYTNEELIGKNHRLLKSGDQPDEVFIKMWKTISNGNIWRGKIKNRAKDGSHYWVDAIIAPVLNERGRPKEYIAQRFVLEKETMEANADINIEK